MLSPGTYNFNIRQGNSGALIFRFLSGEDPVDLTGSEMVFRASRYGIECLRKTTEDDSLLMPTPTNGEVVLRWTFEESHLFFVGGITKYEIERRVSGEQNTVLQGVITGQPGVNDDV